MSGTANLKAGRRTSDCPTCGEHAYVYRQAGFGDPQCRSCHSRDSLAATRERKREQTMDRLLAECLQRDLDVELDEHGVLHVTTAHRGVAHITSDMDLQILLQDLESGQMQEPGDA